jgi:hypothetical protein
MPSMTTQGTFRRIRRILRSVIETFVRKARAGFGELTEPDEVLHDREILAWAESKPGTVRIAQAQLRARVRMAGEVRVVTVRTDTEWPDFEVVLHDGTGEVRARWLGRESIPGVIPGARMVVEGVLGEEDGERLMIDPSYEVSTPQVR